MLGGTSLCVTLPIDWAKEQGIKYQQKATLIPRKGFAIIVFLEARETLPEEKISQIVSYIDRKIQEANDGV